MASEEILKLLIAERDKLDGAIRALKGGSGGIPSPFSEQLKKPAGKKAAKKAKRTVSPEARAKMAAAAKKRWAERKAAAKKAAKKA